MTETEPYVLPMSALDRPEWAATDDWYRIDDASGYWYAYGRLDQGHPPVVIFPVHSPTEPSQSASAWHFGHLWALMQHEYRDPNGRGGYFPSLQGAWANYVETGGRSLILPREPLRSV